MPPERGGGNSPERGETTTSSLIGSRGGGGSGRGRCEEMRGLGQSFYRRLGRGGGGGVPARRAAAAMKAAQWWRRDGSVQVVATGRLGHSARRRKAPNLAGERVMARRRGGWWLARIASMADHGRGGRG
jgi:hypothetical protein